MFAAVKQRGHTTQGDYHKLSDEELVYRYSQKLDHTAISCLFERYGHIVYGVCLKYLGSVNTATRATQDVFLRITEELKAVEVDYFKPWLYHFTERYCLNRGGATGGIQEADFDKHSACLTRRQLKNYATGLMITEEAQATEAHLDGCPMCRYAVDGLQKTAHTNAAADALHALNDDFLKDHFGWHHPEVHLNTMTPAAHMVSGRNRQRKMKVDGFRTSPSLALFVLLLLGLIWYVQAGRHNFSRSQQLTREAAAKEAEEQIAAKPVVETITVVAAEPVSTPQPMVAATQPAITAEPAITAPVAIVAPPTTAATQPVAVQAEKAPVQIQQETAPMKATESKALPITTEEHKPDIKQATTNVVVDNMSKAKVLYDQQKYTAALKLYKQELNSADKKTRQQAGLMIANIYEKTGQKDKARESLETVIEDGGKEKRQAKRMLKEMKAEEAAPGLQNDEL